jgi:NAD(P)-dependent dehydrogenase (short-subunit alcohol dehydrogenase family)
MGDRKEVVLLTGASGSMGFEAFKLLWEKRKRYDIVLLLRPSGKNKKKFRSYEKEASATGGLRSSGGMPFAAKMWWRPAGASTGACTTWP